MEAFITKKALTQMNFTPSDFKTKEESGNFQVLQKASKVRKQFMNMRNYQYNLVISLSQLPWKNPLIKIMPTESMQSLLFRQPMAQPRWKLSKFF